MEGWIVVSAISAAAAGVGSVTAAFAAIWLARVGQKQVRVTQDQIYNEHRPLLVPVGAPIFKPDNDRYLKWEENLQPLFLQNLGTGTALNVAGVLRGCATYLSDDKGTITRFEGARDLWTCWLGVPIAPGEPVASAFKTGGGVFRPGNDSIGPYTLKAPDEPDMRAITTDGALWAVARVTVTYHDIFERKHTSIFDYVLNQGWHMVAILSDVERDLFDLEGMNRAALPPTTISADTTAGRPVEHLVQKVTRRVR